MLHLLAALGLTAACSGEALTEGVEQPIRAHAAQFRAGDLPGSRPVTAGETSTAKPKTPNVTSLSLATRIFDAGTSSRSLSGRASTDAYAIGVQLKDEGDGYWLVPVSVPDPLNGGEFNWALRFDLSPDLPAGRHHLLVAALAKDGSAGTQSSSEICVRSAIPDNLNACTATRKPPALVVSLSWETAADLDLRLRLPSGEFVDRSAPEVSGAQFVSDGNANCQTGLRPREHVVWGDEAPPGKYQIYARPFTACGVVTTELTASVYGVRGGATSGTFKQVKLFEKRSVLSLQEAAAGNDLGLFVTEFRLD